ncbi:addiction module protein [Thiomicrospira sp.]|uniref:addiction module protein n=1 Tax=Thiomicrospira sp. TaxID=935 RepID=UPI002F9367CB
MQAEILFKEALHLSPIDRVKLVELLMDSFTSKPVDEHEQAWATYAESVCDEVDAGATLHSLDSVMRELNQ